MTAGDFAQVLTAIGVVITAVGTYRNGRNGKARGNRLEEQLEVVHKATNGMSQQLQDFAEARGNVAGKAEGKAEEKANPT